MFIKIKTNYVNISIVINDCASINSYRDNNYYVFVTCIITWILPPL